MPAPTNRKVMVKSGILIGGTGEKKTLRMVAQYADMCNFFAFLGNEEITRLLDVLKGHCETVGRPYEEIERTALASLNPGPDGIDTTEAIEMCRSLAEVGIQKIILNMPNNYDVAHIETIGREIIPAVADF